jgi:Zn-dependent alcohol dehydrogenase
MERTGEPVIRAAVLEHFGEALAETEIQVNGVAQDEVLVRVVASGICHTDRTVHLGAQDRRLPLVLGHEASGVVERIGAAVTGFAPGDHVVGAASACCGRCGYCLRGLTQHCADKGLTRTGGGARLTRGGEEVHAFVGLGGFADHMLEVVGLGATMEQAFAVAGVRGQVTVVGVARPEERITLPAACDSSTAPMARGASSSSARRGDGRRAPARRVPGA